MGTLVENVLSRLIAPIVGVVVDRVFPSGETREQAPYKISLLTGILTFSLLKPWMLNSSIF